MQTSVEVRYAGVVVARANEVRKGDKSGMGLFVPLPDPLPVGTTVELRAEGADTRARIQRVIESANADAAGMFVQLLDADAAWALAVANAPEQTADAEAPVVVDLSRAEEIRVTRETVLQAGRDAAPPLSDSAGSIVVAPVPVAEAAVVMAAPPVAEEIPVLPAALSEAAATVGQDLAAGPIPAGLGADDKKRTLLYYGGATQPAAGDGSEAQVDDLPPARPVAGDGRRKTQRRKRK